MKIKKIFLFIYIFLIISCSKIQVVDPIVSYEECDSGMMINISFDKDDLVLFDSKEIQSELKSLFYLVANVCVTSNEDKICYERIYRYDMWNELYSITDSFNNESQFFSDFNRFAENFFVFNNIPISRMFDKSSARFDYILNGTLSNGPFLLAMQKNTDIILSNIKL